MLSETVLVLAGPFDERLDADQAADVIGRGLATDGQLACDLCPLEEGPCTRAADASGVLNAVDFDRRMRASRALVIACAHLSDRTLTGSVAFEAATRARQGGVPAYAITAQDKLDRFEARIVDLQVILEAGTARALTAAGKKLASML